MTYSHQNLQRVWTPFAFRMMVNCLVLCGCFGLIETLTHAGENGGHRGSSERHSKASEPRQSSPSRPMTSSNGPASRGFHPEFSRAPRVDANSGSQPRSRTSSQSQGGTPLRPATSDLRGADSQAASFHQPKTRPSHTERQPDERRGSSSQPSRQSDESISHRERPKSGLDQNQRAPGSIQAQAKSHEFNVKNEQPIPSKPTFDTTPRVKSHGPAESHTARKSQIDESVSGKGDRDERKVEIRRPRGDGEAAAVETKVEQPEKVAGKIRIRKPEDRETQRPSLSDKRSDIREKDPTLQSVTKIRPQFRSEKGGEVAKKIDGVKTVERDALDVAAKDKPARLKEGQTLSRDHVKQVKHDIALEQTKLKDGKPVERIRLHATPDMHKVNAERLRKLPREQMKLPVAKNGKLDSAQIQRLKLRPARETFQDRIKSGELNRITKLKSGTTFQMQRQFALHRDGDLSRRMNLLPALRARGGWRHRHLGPISPLYHRHCLPFRYTGPSFCGPHVWYPRWSPWVDWCWWDTCSPIYDPRPSFCRPVFYDPCSSWVAWNYPTWQPLPSVSCGTWVDVDPSTIANGVDLQLLAVRFVDPGHPTQELGPRYRVWFRNNSPAAVSQPFNVLLLASNDGNAQVGLPEAGVRITSMAAGEVQSVDIRLPFAVNSMGQDSEGRPLPFGYLNVFVDSHNELSELVKANNGAAIVRGEVLPVDPVIFAADPARVEPNGVTHLAGEGFGPEPGKIMVVIGEQEFEAEVVGWFDLGVQIRIPDFEIDEATAADLIIVRGDGAASPPLTIEINPNQVESEKPGPDRTSSASLGPAPPPEE